MMTRAMMVSAIACGLLLPLAAQQQTVFQRWLNEDVFWIISDQERAEFNRLQTDEARAQFVESFWLRRDPTPDTLPNEFAVEHYRRIAYANDRFSSPSHNWPGWKTDRGMMYIRFGAPDEKDEHAGGAAQEGARTESFPYERWRYRYLEGIGQDVVLEFVDTTRSNEFRLTWDPVEKDALRPTPGARLTLQQRLGLIEQSNPR